MKKALQSLKATRDLLYYSSIVCTLSTSDLLARAGGGGGYSGGGSGSGFSGGGSFGGGGFSSGGGSFSSYSSNTPGVETNALTGFIILLFVIIFGAHFLYEKTQRGHHQKIRSNTIGRRRWGSISRQQEQKVIQRIRSNEPAFDAEAFKKRFQIAFYSIQEAWQQQAIATVQHFLSDGIMERFSLQIREQQELGYRNKMEQVRITESNLAHYHLGTHFETLYVRVVASAIDSRVSLTTGAHISGSKSPESFVEFWTFIRRRGVVSKLANGLFEGNCPNCAAPIRLNQQGNCNSCQASIRNGQHDWILSEITQACEWRIPTQNLDLTASTYALKNDPGFSIEHLEDRASVIFWRKVMSDRLGAIEPLRKMASEAFCQNYEKTFYTETAHRSLIGDCSVGSVDCCGLIVEKDWHYTLLKIRWSGTPHRVSRGAQPQPTGDWRRFSSLMVLGRIAGKKSQVERTLSSAHCPSCGAPEGRSTSHSCEYCSATLNTGEWDWILLDFIPYHSSAAKTWLEKRKTGPAHKSQKKANRNQPAQAPASIDALAWTARMMLSDGVIDAQEMASLHRMAQSANIPRERADALLQQAGKDQLDLPQTTNYKTCRLWLESMTDAALLDGTMQPAERKLLEELGAKVNYQKADIDILIRQRQVKLYQEAKVG